MSHSEVPRIQLSDDGTVTFFVNVYGFDPGTPVEISGHATQANGAVATFHEIQPMPTTHDPAEGVIMVVRGVPVIGSTFTEEEPVMVVARAADVWITKLQLDKGEKRLSEAVREAMARAGQVNARAAWNSDEENYHSVYGTEY